MHIEYEITPEDLFAFQWRAAFDSPRGRRARRIAYAAWTVAILLFAIVPAIGADGFTFSRISFGFIVVALAIAFLLQWVLERFLMRRAIRSVVRDERPERGRLGRHRLVLREDGVHESTAVGESFTSWAGVDRVEQSPEYFYIFTAPYAAHVIPRRAFGNPGEAEAFLERARSRKDAAG